MKFLVNPKVAKKVLGCGIQSGRCGVQSGKAPVGCGVKLVVAAFRAGGIRMKFLVKPSQVRKIFEACGRQCGRDCAQCNRLFFSPVVQR